MGLLDNFIGGSGHVEDFTEQEPYTDITAGGRRRRKSLRRKGARKGTRKRARKHYGGYSHQKQQQGGATLAELEDKVTRGTITADEQSELDGLREAAKEAAERAEKEAAERAASERTADQGGSRRRKSRHSKKTHSKKTRGKKTSAWIKHVLQFAKDNKMKYFQALKDKRCRATYKSSK